VDLSNKIIFCGAHLTHIKLIFFEPRVQFTVSCPKHCVLIYKITKKMTRVSDLSTDPTRESLTQGNGYQGAVPLAGPHIASRVKGCESPKAPSSSYRPVPCFLCLLYVLWGCTGMLMTLLTALIRMRSYVTPRIFNS